MKRILVTGGAGFIGFHLCERLLNKGFIGNPHKFTMLELAKEILDLKGNKSKIIYLPLLADDPVQHQPDISLTRKMLDGWEPKIQLREGLQKTIEYFDQMLNK